MSLKDKINTDLTAAIKSGNAETVSVLRFLNSVVKNKELEKRSRLAKEGKALAELENLSALNDEETTAVILGEIKKRKDSIAQYKAGGREELAQKEAAELEILKKYINEA